MNLLKLLRSRFHTALGSLVDDPIDFVEMVKPSQDAKFGDFQANCAMPLSKRLGKPPRDVAQLIIEQLDVDEFCETPEIAGPGFINLRVKDDWLSARINAVAGDDALGVTPVEDPRKFVVDYSSPNVAKPMHVGHLRSTVIGAAVCKILKAVGHEVLSDNHIGDWGTQFGMITFGYKHFLDEDAFAEAPVKELARLYRLVNQLSEYHAARAKLPELTKRLELNETELQSMEEQAKPDDKSAKKALKKQRAGIEQLKEEIRSLEKKIAGVDDDEQLSVLAETHQNIARGARDETAKLHQGDAENLTLWKEFMPICLDAMQAVYDRLEIEFDMTLGESYYQPMLADVVADLQQKDLASESDGAMCVFVSGNDAPFIVRKADKAFTYATTDLATIQYRVNELNADALVYVVDTRQSEHFQLLFATAKQWGFAETEYHHVNFGTVMGEDKKPYKTRSGDAVGLESLLDEAVVRSRKIVDENDEGSELDEETRQQIAEIVGLGGIKFADLKHNRESDYVFNWDKMLAKEGDTATYIQYAYARIHGIFRRGETTPEAIRGSEGALLLTNAEERGLALKLLNLQEALEEAAREFKPHVLAQYVLETARMMTGFYKHSVLKAETEELKVSRLKLCELTARVLAYGLGLLGIHVAERM